MLYRTLACLLGIALSGGSLGAQAVCPVRGVWVLDSVTVDGAAQPMGQFRQMKIVTARHYGWMGQEPGPTTLASAADSLAMYRAIGFGGGTYRVSDSTYTEKLEYFSLPEYIGREVTFSCRVAGDRWYHAAAAFPMLQGGREVRTIRLEEVWRRVE